MMLKRCLFLLLFIATTCWGAGSQLYKVELIVFSHISPAAVNSEQWPANPVLPSLAQAVNLLPAPQAGASIATYQMMPAASLDLRSAVAKLRASQDYVPLVHVAWLQTGMPIRNARRIHIYGGQAYAAAGHADAGSNWQLNGYVRASQPYLFQLDINLALLIPHAQLARLAASNIKSDQFVLNETVRMKLGELYYIDHPLFGVLAKVTRYPTKSKNNAAN